MTPMMLEVGVQQGKRLLLASKSDRQSPITPATLRKSSRARVAGPKLNV